jgi:hypothetical protein
MDCEYWKRGFWKNLPSPATPVSAIQIHPDFHQNLCDRLNKLHVQILVRNELLSKEVLEYRFGHTPPGFYDQDETERDKRDYIKYLQAPTPPTPTTSSSHSSPITRSMSRSSPHHTHQTTPLPPAPLKPVPAEIERHETVSPLGIDKKRKRDAEEGNEPHDQSRRQRGMQVGIELDMRNGTGAVAVPACLSQCSADSGLSRDLGACEVHIASSS